MPMGARQPTDEGLTRAVIYYFDDLVDYLSWTGDAEPLLAYCPRSVELCDEFVEVATAHHAADRYYEVGPLTFSEIDIHELWVEGRPARLFDAVLQVETSQLRRHDHTVIGEESGAVVRFRAVLEHADGAWRDHHLARRLPHRHGRDRPWQASNQTATTTSEPHHLNLITATPHLIP